MAKLSNRSFVKVGGVKVKIIKANSLMREHDAQGMIAPEIAEILIDPAMHPDVADMTVLHEVVEYISFTHELRLPHRTIMTLATVLHQFMKDNGLLPK